MPQLSQLKENLEIAINNNSLIEQAFIHRSALNESKKKLESNERLEFLGDSILSFLVSRHLYDLYPRLPEGELTNLRSSVVKTSTLSEIAGNLKLGQYLKLSHGEEESGGRSNQSILADTFEALLGAVYLDSGLPSVNKIIKENLLSKIPKIYKEKTYKDAKSSFQEMVQEETKISPLYKVVDEKGPDHAKQFTVAVFVKERKWGIGTGKNKQEAEQMAAVNAIVNWKQK